MPTPLYVDRPLYRSPTQIPGATNGAAGDLASSGNLFTVPQRTAGTSADITTWGHNLVADQTAHPVPPVAHTLAVQRRAVSLASFPPDQGWLLRILVPGHRANTPAINHIFHFGGENLPSAAGGGGHFAVSLGGDGIAILWMRLTVGGSLQWVQGKTFRYHDTHAGGSIANLFIQPYVTPKGPCIDFRAGASDEVTPVGGRPTALAPATSLVRSSHFNLTAIPGIIQNIATLAEQLVIKSGIGGMTNATGGGVVRHDGQPDARTPFQLSRMTYVTASVLIDQSFSVDQLIEVNTNFVVDLQMSLPADTTILWRMYDATTGTALLTTAGGTDVTSTAVNHVRDAEFIPAVVGHQSYYMWFELSPSSDGNFAPILHQYRVNLSGTTGVVSIGSFEVPVTSVSITGAESDPTHETANINVEDLAGAFGKLNVRGHFPCRIETEYDPLDASKRAWLFRGYIRKVLAKKKGTPGRVYPSQFWRGFDCSLLGKWVKLKASYPPKGLSFASDPLAPPGAPGTPFAGIQPPYKVTDMIRAAFNWAGEVADIQDLPLRFFSAAGASTTTDTALIIDTSIDCAELIIGWCYDYLGMWPYHDESAGDDGVWRLFAPSYPPYANVWHFVTKSPPGKAAWDPAAYPPNTTFIRGKRSLETFIELPTHNIVKVRGVSGYKTGSGAPLAVDSAPCVNFKSFGPLADPNSPDYLGYAAPLFLYDLGIVGQDMADWFCRRYFDLTCHGIKHATFDAPLVLLPPNILRDASQVRPRKLRYYDPVTITSVDQATGLLTTGQWLIRDCNPTYRRDHLQWAHYECIAPNELTTGGFLLPDMP